MRAKAFKKPRSLSHGTCVSDVSTESSDGVDAYGSKSQGTSQLQENGDLSTQTVPSDRPLYHCSHCGKDAHKDGYCYRKRKDERMQKEWANKDRYCPSSGVPKPRVAPLPRGEGSVRTFPRGPRAFPARGFPT